MTNLEQSKSSLLGKLKNHIVSFLISFAVFLVILAGVLGLFGNVLFQEGNPITPIAAIIKLQVSNQVVVEMGNNSGKYMTKIEDGEAYENLKEMMAQDGWQYKDQFGSAFLFEKNKEQITVSTRMYTRNYVVIEIPLIERPTTY